LIYIEQPGYACGRYAAIYAFCVMLIINAQQELPNHGKHYDAGGQFFWPESQMHLLSNWCLILRRLYNRHNKIVAQPGPPVLCEWRRACNTKAKAAANRKSSSVWSNPACNLSVAAGIWYVNRIVHKKNI
jgi:hypothetical protein